VRRLDPTVSPGLVRLVPQQAVTTGNVTGFIGLRHRRWLGFIWHNYSDGKHEYYVPGTWREALIIPYQYDDYWLA
jgi:hypothetical protein